MVEVVGALAISAIGSAIGVADLAAFSVAGIGVGTLAGEAIIGGAAIGLSALLKPNVPGLQSGGSTLPPPEAGSVPVKQPISPRIVGYGRVRLAGAYVLYEANAGISYDIIAFHHGAISGIVGYYLDDDVITIGGTGIVDVQGDGRYASNCITIKTRLGAVPETAYSEITTPLSAIWTSAHRGDGLASLALICAQAADPATHANQYPRGKPTPSVVADCTAIYDPRDVAQSRTDSTTWKVSANPVLQIIDFLTNADRGMGLDWSTLIAPGLGALMAEADLCDAQVLRNDGTSEARYSSNGSFPLDADPADVLSPIIDACDGWISQNGDGSLAIKVGVYRAPVVALTSKHIRGVSIQYDVGNEAAVNELTIDYTEPLLDYKTEPGQPWRDETDISVRGKTLSQRFALPWVYSHPQARRLAKRKMARLRAPLRGTITTTLYGLQALGERWVSVDAPDIVPDLAGLVIEVASAQIDLLNAQMVFTFVSADPATIDAWDPASEEGSAPVVASKLVVTPPPVPQNVTAVAHNNGTSTMVVTCDATGRSDLSFQSQWRVNGSGGAFTTDTKQAPFANPTFPGPKPHIYGGNGIDHNVKPAVIYEVQMRAFAPTGSGSAWSASTTVSIGG